MKRRTLRDRSKQGFTLLEIFLALGMVGTALVAVAGAVQMCGRRVREARQLLVASRVAEAQLNLALQSIDPDKLDTSGRDDGHPDYRWELSVEEGEPYPFQDLTLGERTWVIRVRVHWDRDRRQFEAVARRLRLPSDGRTGL